MTGHVTSRTLIEYFEALDRLKKGCTRIVPTGTKITNDAVAIEAGRSKGSIKRSRTSFGPLIIEIANAASTKQPVSDEFSARAIRLERARNEYRRLYEEALGRELSLLHEVYGLKKELSRLTGGKILPLRKKIETNLD
jgi:hypothetical protein